MSRNAAGFAYAKYDYKTKVNTFNMVSVQAQIKE